MFPHLNFHNFTPTSPDGKVHSQTEHIAIDRRRHSVILDVRLFWAADWNTDHYLMEKKVRERLAVRKERAHIFQMESLNLKKLKHVEGKEQYRLEISNKIWNI
jgi:hypothetical protein